MSLSPTALVRSVSGTELPRPGTWAIDAGHTAVEFVGRHLVFTKVRGRFSGVEGTVVVGEDPRDSKVQVTIDMASVESGSRDRDDHLRSKDFFDVAEHPTASFRSTSVEWRGGPTAVLHGELEIVGVRRPVALDVRFEGAQVDPWGGQRAIFSATTEIDREDWGLTFNQVLESGGLLVSKAITIEISTELVLTPAVA